ncbi:endonuclease V [Actinopolymorpha rutila]|uniref:Deoxyribonuclease V n=1 Tax=Actinopolymorpha rutila TaxID=446787 RepID=A0A852ZPM1_9ACTN|nr:deoxyribonuclease V [Actinopolymorpha rutila]
MGVPERWWPDDPAELAEVQAELGARSPAPWRPPAGRPIRIGGCFCCFPLGVEGFGERGDPLWVAAVTYEQRRRLASAVRTDLARAPYVAGLLAMREGPALAAAVAELTVSPDVLLVNATGRDHPRAAGLAYHLGAALDLPTVGVTHRPLLATGAWPADEAGAAGTLSLAGAPVGAWVRTRAGRRPLVAHAGWRTDPDTAVEVVRLATGTARTPVPLREARRLARRARALR